MFLLKIKIMINKELELAKKYIENTNQSVFLTGKAGTGKTTFLHNLIQNSFKRKVVVAPTGIAAINAKGVTIHSFFQLPFGPIAPDSLFVSKNFKHKINRQKIDIIKSLDLLIIDEISMVRADLLDGIDQILRKYRNSDKAFGGVQLLMVGDLQQLAPVVKQDEWSLLKEHYNSPYFFSSKAFQKTDIVTIELKNIYRQENEDFINILNEIRNNKITEDSLKKLNSRYLPDFDLNKNEGYIILTTHNNKADKINAERMASISEKSKFYRANINGDFSEYLYPLPEELELKKGAQVMFVKNDSSYEKRYYNGKLAIVESVNSKSVIVKSLDDNELIEVFPELWQNTSYKVNSKTKEIEEKVLGEFSQIPLRPAWAITIHKSQGLTFDKAIIDTAAAFSHGQTYVALSRCRSLEGIVLTSPVSRSSIIVDNRVSGFIEQTENIESVESKLENAKASYQLSLIDELFDYNQLVLPLYRLNRITQQAGNSLKSNLNEKVNLLNQKVKYLLDIQKKFALQLKNIFQKNNILPEKDSEIQERYNKAVMFYIKYIKTEMKKVFDDIEFVTDNKQIKKEINENLSSFELELNKKLFILSNLTKNFNTKDYLKYRAEAALMKAGKDKTENKISIKNVKHKDLFLQLKLWRELAAESEEVAIYQIFKYESLFDICEKLPVSKKQLKEVKGFGPKRIKNYGDEIINIVKEYCEKNSIEPGVDPEPKAPKINTAEVSFNMFVQGLDIEEIAKNRNLKPQTIEVHLGKYVAEGVLDIFDIIPEQKVTLIIEKLKEYPNKHYSELKAILPENISYSQIKIVDNYLKSLNEKN